MKVHRIITTIEVENDNSITSIELTKLYPANADIPLAITNLTTMVTVMISNKYMLLLMIVDVLLTIN